jgi:hypothetical protein
MAGASYGKRVGNKITGWTGPEISEEAILRRCSCCDTRFCFRIMFEGYSLVCLRESYQGVVERVLSSKDLVHFMRLDGRS